MNKNAWKLVAVWAWLAAIVTWAILYGQGVFGGLS